MNFKVAIPWILRALGVNSFIDRVLHVPQDVLPAAAALAEVTPEQWRRVEAVQRRIVKEGIDAKVGTVGTGGL